ncbi:MAG: hypothetical protein CMJ83_10790 [Planctomycetes bacterium]|nr:hypothetical protein [Planctomycetota bacterium]
MSGPRLEPKRALEIDNALRVAEDIFAERTVWEGRPFHVEISTNNACNLSCVMCERPDLSYISGEKLDVVADVVLPHASVITPSATSEPAMGDFDRILDHCEKHDLRLNLITNGNLITDRHIDRLRGRIFKVDFSIDSHIPSVYEQIRVGGRHGRMLAGLRRLVRLQQEEGFQLTLIVVLMKQNLTTLDGTMSFARQVGVDRVRVQKMLPFFKDPHRFHVDEHFSADEIRLHIGRAVAAAKRENINLELALDPVEHHRAPGIAEPEVTPPVVVNTLYEAVMEKKKGFCFQLASYVRIIPNGNVYPCCRGWGEHLRMGNIFEQSFDEIWNGPEYQKLREEFLSGDLREGCRQCTLSGQGTL